jgi:hypothetical protein
MTLTNAQFAQQFYSLSQMNAHADIDLGDYRCLRYESPKETAG